MTRKDRIAWFRRSKNLRFLKARARKAKSKTGLWTLEEVEYEKELARRKMPREYELILGEKLDPSNSVMWKQWIFSNE